MGVSWRVYYGDGASYSDADGPPWDAPCVNTQAVAMVDDRVGRFILSHYDYYWWEADQGRWYGGDQFGLWDYLTRPGWRKVLFGRSLANDRFDAVMRRALEDPDLPAKSGWSPKEHRAG